MQSTIHGIILKKKNLLNTDVLLTVLTKEHGKKKYILKGVNTIKSKRKPLIETGNIIEGIERQTARGVYLEHIVLKSALMGIKTSEALLPALYQFLYVLDTLLPEEVAEDYIFNEYLKAVTALHTRKNPRETYETFGNSVLRALGYSHITLSFEQIQKKLAEISERKPLNLAL